MALTIPVSEIVEKTNNSLLGKHATWGRVLLGEIATVQNGFAFKSAQFTTDEGMPIIRIRDVGKDKTDTNYAGEYDPIYVVRAGDLLVGMDGDFNCARWHGPDGLLNQRVCRISLHSEIYHPKFLDYALPGYLKAINDVTSSVTVKHLSSKSIKEIPLPLPPLDQQKCIVAEIEKQFSRLDEAVANLKRVKANLKRYKAAVLKAAVEGKLTEEWRKQHPDVDPADKLLERILAERREKWELAELAKMEDKGRLPKNDKWKGRYKEIDRPDLATLPEIPNGWCWLTIDHFSFVTKLAGFEYTKFVKYDPVGDLAVIKAENAGKDGFKKTEFSKVKSETVAHLTRSKVEAGDLLMVFVGAGTGQVARVPNDQSYFLGPNIGMIRIQSVNVLPAYLEYYLRSPIGKQLALGFAKAVAQPSLSMGSIRMIPVPIPPLEEQTLIVSKLEGLQSKIDSLAITEKNNSQRAGRLRQSILKEAFSGRFGAE